VALIERSTLKRAKALFSFLVDGVLGTPPEPSAAPSQQPNLAPRAIPVPSSPLLSDPAFVGLGASHEPDGFLLAWRTTSHQLEDAQRVATQKGAPSLRLVLVRADGEVDVAVDTVDLGQVGPEGARLLPAVPDVLSAVASIGLFDGKCFVSMAHATLI
jgi:hypothetical protein